MSVVPRLRIPNLNIFFNILSVFFLELFVNEDCEAKCIAKAKLLFKSSSNEGILSPFMDQNQEQFCLHLTRIPTRGLSGHFTKAGIPGGSRSSKVRPTSNIFILFSIFEVLSFNHIFQDIFQGGWFHLKSIFFMGP